MVRAHGKQSYKYHKTQEYSDVKVFVTVGMVNWPMYHHKYLLSGLYTVILNVYHSCSHLCQRQSSRFNSEAEQNAKTKKTTQTQCTRWLRKYSVHCKLTEVICAVICSIYILQCSWLT